MSRAPPSSTLFPYTTLFRSDLDVTARREEDVGRLDVAVQDPGRMCRGQRRQHVVEHLADRSEEHTSELQSHVKLVCRLLLEKKNGGASRCPPGRRCCR